MSKSMLDHQTSNSWSGVTNDTKWWFHENPFVPQRPAWAKFSKPAPVMARQIDSPTGNKQERDKICKYLRNPKCVQSDITGCSFKSISDSALSWEQYSCTTAAPNNILISQWATSLSSWLIMHKNMHGWPIDRAFHRLNLRHTQGTQHIQIELAYHNLKRIIPEDPPTDPLDIGYCWWFLLPFLTIVNHQFAVKTIINH